MKKEDITSIIINDIMEIMKQEKMKRYLTMLHFGYLSGTGRFDFYSVEDLSQDLLLHLFLGVKRKIEEFEESPNDLVLAEMRKYFTGALIRIVAKNYVIDLIRQKSSKLPIAAIQPEDNDFILDVVRHTENEDHIVVMESYLMSLGIDDQEELELLEEILVHLTDTQKEILKCLLYPDDLYIDFFQVYLKELGIRNESEIISRYLMITGRTYMVEVRKIRDVVSKILNRSNDL